jgi:predicted branched-subunit amino acid permease
MRGSGYRAGARAVLPLLVGVIPFGVVAGAIAIDNGLSPGVAIASSIVVFAGASQVAMYDVLGDGGSAFVAALAAWTINARLLLYSASLAPHVSDAPLRKRLLAGYLLSDQAYIVAMARYAAIPEAEDRVEVAIGAGATLWISWLASTIVGALVGSSLPADAPVGAIAPIVFLVLLLPVLDRRPAMVAAAVGGTVALLAADAGAGGLTTVFGAVAGVVAGALVDSDTNEIA